MRSLLLYGRKATADPSTALGAKYAPNFAQDDEPFAERTSDSAHSRQFVILSESKGRAEGSAVAFVRLRCCIMRAMHSGSYFTYIMASRSHTLYIGVTGNLRKRVFKYKWKEHDGFTERYNRDRLVWFESHQDVVKAIEREKQLKGWRRSKKIALIEKTNPAWVDLSRDWYDVEPADWKRVADRMDV